MADTQMFEALRGVTTATLTTVLLKKGLRKVWMTGTRPLAPNQPRVVGRAFTMRFIPARAGVHLDRHARLLRRCRPAASR